MKIFTLTIYTSLILSTCIWRCSPAKTLKSKLVAFGRSCMQNNDVASPEFYSSVKVFVGWKLYFTWPCNVPTYTTITDQILCMKFFMILGGCKSPWMKPKECNTTTRASQPLPCFKQPTHIPIKFNLFIS